ncbi:MAG: hypothetical protein V1891_02175 [bacterium]
MLIAELHNFIQKNFFLREKIIITNLIASLILILGLLFLLVLKLGLKFNSEAQLFLHYNIYFGIDWIGSWYEIYLYPLAGLSIIIINYIFAIFFYSRDKMISYLFACGATFAEIIIFAAGLCVIWINS